MWAQLINTALGIWLMFAPFVLGYNDIAADIDHTIGPVIATFAITAIFESTRVVRKFNIPLGAWLLVSPWVLGYAATEATVNSMVVGALVILFSFIKGKVENRFGGGWSVLWK
ncbi:MAG: SPW repeat protein [Hymenobacteraceae bacterium]|nr:SPW repeat protein [Hymenobacteraceae bacterium]MDX5395418.1 SPW repeat protein [Hymenobacteraceae bacterium]MDX5511467.1 SPW repeat protein [Hymenobacteraceae bacterium]